MSNQTEHQRYANRADEAEDRYGNGSQIADEQVTLLIQTLFFLINQN